MVARYSAFFKLRDYPRAIRDTEHCIKLMDFVYKYAKGNNDKIYYEEFRPAFIRANMDAKILLEIERENFSKAIEYAKKAIKKIHSLPVFYIKISTENIEYPIPDKFPDSDFVCRVFDAITYFNNRLEEIDNIIKLKDPKLAELSMQLKNAVAGEDYETAAKLRDKINAMKEDV
jgi:tetratricopeptide (TPR) repeat protein